VAEKKQLILEVQHEIKVEKSRFSMVQKELKNELAKEQTKSTMVQQELKNNIENLRKAKEEENHKCNQLQGQVGEIKDQFTSCVSQLNKMRESKVVRIGTINNLKDLINKHTNNMDSQ
jgi:uncharacterized coiled-coil DUF342 family protein